MRYYQMDANMLANELSCDLENGCEPEVQEQKKGFSFELNRLLNGLGKHYRSKFYFIDVIVLVCYAVCIIFSCLNRSWDLLALILGALLATTSIFLVEGYLLYRYREAYYERISENGQTVHVIRGGTLVEIAPDRLVKGDLLCLNKGMILYADARIVDSSNLFAEENTVFSKTIPSEKNADPIPEKNILPENQKNMVWKGSYISSGSGRAIVTAVGEDCYVEKTGGRKTKKQRSFFYNKQNNIGHIASYALIILFALCMLISVIFTNNYIEAFLVMAVSASLILLNPVSCLMEWTYYRTASKLYKQGVLIRNIEAFDGMNKEKELYFNADDLLKEGLIYSNSVDYIGSEKSSLSYFALCMGEGRFTDLLDEPLRRYELSYDKLNNSFPVFRRSIDSSGNVYSVFSNNGNSVAVAAGYWERMLPLLKVVDDSLLEQIREMEIHGKLVYIMTNDAMDFIPTSLDHSYFKGRMSLTALIVFDVPISADTVSMIHQLKRATMHVSLINHFSETLGSYIAAAYDMDDVVEAAPETSCYSLPDVKHQNLVAGEDASPIEKEQAMVVLAPNVAPHRVIYDVKCMFCGIRRCLNFLAVSMIFLAFTTLVLFLYSVPLYKLIVPLLLFNPVFMCICYYLIESVRNCNQYHRSFVLGLFCGASSFVGALIHNDMALFTLGISSLFLSLYFLLSGHKRRRIRAKDVIILAVVAVAVIVPWLFMGGNWAPAIILALFPPLGAFVLDLFY